MLQRTVILVFAVVILTAVQAPAAEDEPRDLVRKLLLAEDADTKFDLVEKILGAAPDPTDVATWLEEGRPYPPVKGGWLKRSIRGADGRPCPFDLLVPEDYDPKRRHPVLIALHHHASHSAAPPGLADRKDPWEELATRDGYILVLPTSRLPTEWWTADGAENVLRILSETKRLVNVDENRVYAVGIGDGAVGCYYLGLTRATPFAGLVPVGGNPSVAGWAGHQVHLRNLSNVPLYVLSMDLDTLYPPDCLEPLIDALKGIDAPVTRQYVFGRAPTPDVVAMEIAAIGDWLGKQRRKSVPKEIVWEGVSGSPSRLHWLEVVEFGAPGAIGAFPDLNPNIPALRPSIGASYDRKFEGVGVRILGARAGQAAAAAGVKKGDVVVGIGDRTLRDISDLREAMADQAWESEVEIRYRRGDQKLEGKGRLGPRGTTRAFHRRMNWSSLRATVEGNEISVTSRGVRAFRVHVSPGLVDLTKPVVVKVNTTEVFNGPVEPDLNYVLEQAIRDDDRTRVWRGQITVRVPAAVAAKTPPAAPGEPEKNPIELEVDLIVREMPPADAARAIFDLIKAKRPSGPGNDLTPAYAALFVHGLCHRLPDDPGALARRLLIADPATAAAWIVLSRVWEFDRSRAADPAPVREAYRTWIKKFAAEVKAGSEVQAALELLSARIYQDTGEVGMAKEHAGRVLDREGISDVLRNAAERILRWAGLPAVGSPAAALGLKTADGTEISLATLRGRAAFLFFDAGDEDAQLFREAAMLIGSPFPAWEVVVVEVPLSESKEVSAGPGITPVTGSDRWLVAEPGQAAAAAAKRYGSAGASSLFLLSPDGRILRNGGWASRREWRKAHEQLLESLGEPVVAMLRRLYRAGWREFRQTWRRLALGKRPLPDAALALKVGGDRAALAIALASASRGKAIEWPGLDLPDDIHFRVGLAWCQMTVTGKSPTWTKLTKPLKRGKVEPCLEVIDPMYNLGLSGDLIRKALQVPAKRGRDWRLVSMVLRTLASQDTDEKPDFLLKHARSKRWQVRLALAECLAGFRTESSLDALINLLGDKKLRVRIAAAASLASLTRQDFGTSQKRWSAWRKDEGKHPDLRPRSRDSVTQRKRPGHHYAKDAYFGLKIASDRLVFVLDKSESMYWGLFDRVVEEVDTFLLSAGPTTSYGVVEFDEKPRLWSDRLLPANDQNRTKVVKWLLRGKPYGPSNIMDSLTMAMAMADTDTVVLLSDGLPNRGAVTDTTEIVTQITAANRYERIAIHTVWMTIGRRFPHTLAGKPKPPIGKGELMRRRKFRETASDFPLGKFLRLLSEENEGEFAVAFGDMVRPAPGTKTRPSTDK